LPQDRFTVWGKTPHRSQSQAPSLGAFIAMSREYRAAPRLKYNGFRYTVRIVIRSFKNKETEKIFHLERSTKLPQDIQQTALRKLRMLNRSLTLDDVRVPTSNRLEKLRGDRAGQWSIRVNDQWRICFEWRDGDAYAVEIVDYH